MILLMLTLLSGVDCFTVNCPRTSISSINTLMKRKAHEVSREITSVVDSPYRIKDGFRIVLPYEFVYRSHVKERWLDKSLYDVLCTEFAAFNDEYINYACRSKRIKIFDKDGIDLYVDDNNDIILKHILKPNDILYHNAIVHEQVALYNPIKILNDTKDYLAVSKPTSIPVYHVGTYHFNSLIEIIKHELILNDIKLYPINRIDKLVSGVVIFAKNSNIASNFTGAIRNGYVKKLYIARVIGDFKQFINKNNDYFIINNDKIAISKGFMKVISRKYSKHEFTMDNSYKNTETRFKFIDYNQHNNESLILCYPVTGRTHQIRAHLKYLGYPISNDGCYNDGELVDSERYFKSVPDVHWIIDENGHWCIPELNFVEKSQVSDEIKSIPFHVGLNRNCDANRRNRTGIYLHSYRYILDGVFDITDELPEWTNEFNINSNDLKGVKLWI